MLGGELTKLKEEVNIGADSVIKNSEKLKNTIRKNIREIKVHMSLSNASLFIHFLMLVTVFSLCLFFMCSHRRHKRFPAKASQYQVHQTE